MHRKITDQLLVWKNAGARKPLILYGARQVGKSYAVEDFAKKCYRQDYVVINFENDRNFSTVFQAGLDPRLIVRRLSDYLGRPIKPTTLIFFDEIQECPAALTALKYFAEANERAPGSYQVIAVGSLLGGHLWRPPGPILVFSRG